MAAGGTAATETQVHYGQQIAEQQLVKVGLPNVVVQGEKVSTNYCVQPRAPEEESSRRPHVTVVSGAVIWCVNCVAYAESKAVKLRCDCKGKPKRGNNHGGAWGQHRKMHKGIHPRTGEQLPPPKRHDGTEWEPGIGKYTRLKKSSGDEVDDKFYRYVPEATCMLQPSNGNSSEAVRAKMQARLEKVRKREAEGTEFAGAILQQVRNSTEIEGQETREVVCLIDAVEHVAKRVRLHSKGTLSTDYAECGD